MKLMTFQETVGKLMKLQKMLERFERCWNVSKKPNGSGNFRELQDTSRSFENTKKVKHVSWYVENIQES